MDWVRQGCGVVVLARSRPAAGCAKESVSFALRQELLGIVSTFKIPRFALCFKNKVSAMSANDQGSVVFHRAQSDATKKLLSADVDDRDKHLLGEGADPSMLKALRNRREQNYANPMTGGVGDGGRLSKCVRLSYAPPSLTTVPLTLLISVYVIQFYEQVGATLGLLAFFQALARGFDVITDPTMSYMTDSLRNVPAWLPVKGRRKPFLFTGAPLYCVCLICLLLPQPNLNSTETSTWFGFFYILFFLMATYVNIPYDALAPELTDNDEDRNLILFTCKMYDGLGAIMAAALPLGMTKFVDSFRENNKLRYTSCDDGGWINALSGAGPWFLAKQNEAGLRQTTAPPSVRFWNVGDDKHRYMNGTASELGLAIADCQQYTTFPEWNSPNSTALSFWCECRAKANVFFDLDTLRYAYGFTGAFFGIWALVSLWVLVYNVKERSEIQAKKEHTRKEPLPKAAPLVPSVLNTFSNKPFVLLLPAFILDALANAIIGSLLTFFVRYIVQPEYSNQDTLGCAPVGGSDNWRCNSTLVLGACVMALLCGAVAFTPFWLFAAKKVGKRNAWLLWSFLNGTTFLFYAPIGKGMVIPCVIMSVLNGAPMGGSFLADSIMCDVIDYDEFLTGARSEATYTMFKGFLPKIAAIPASAVPIALLSTFGHVAPVDGIIQRQPDSLILFIKIVIIYLPSFLAFSAFTVKMRFPLTSKKHNDLIHEGVAAHLVGKEAMDPCSGKPYRPVHFEADEKESVELMGNFPGLIVIQDFIKNPTEAKNKLVAKSKLHLCMAIFWLAGFAGISAGSFGLLLSTKKEDVDLQFIPVLAIVGFGMGITLIAFTVLRLMGAKELANHTPTEHCLKKLLKTREQLDGLKDFPCDLKTGCSMNPRTLEERLAAHEQLSNNPAPTKNASKVDLELTSLTETGTNSETAPLKTTDTLA